MSLPKLIVAATLDDAVMTESAWRLGDEAPAIWYIVSLKFTPRPFSRRGALHLELIDDGDQLYPERLYRAVLVVVRGPYPNSERVVYQVSWLRDMRKVLSQLGRGRTIIDCTAEVLDG